MQDAIYNPFYYKPLPDEITLQESQIEGLGIFATSDMEPETDLGTTHIKVPMFHGYIRTPLGGFLNHAEEANCELVLMHDWDDCKIYNLVTIRQIKSGEELVLNYED